MPPQGAQIVSSRGPYFLKWGAQIFMKFCEKEEKTLLSLFRASYIFPLKRICTYFSLVILSFIIRLRLNWKVGPELRGGGPSFSVMKNIGKQSFNNITD